jgi:hypothetical protein
MLVRPRLGFTGAGYHDEIVEQVCYTMPGEPSSGSNRRRRAE